MTKKHYITNLILKFIVLEITLFKSRKKDVLELVLKYTNSVVSLF